MLEPAGGLPRRARHRRGRDRGQPDRRRPLERHLPDRAGRRARSCCAARRARRCRRAPTTCCARRACCRRCRTRPARVPDGARGVRRSRADRSALLRDGADRGRGDRRERARARSTRPEQRRRIGEELIDALVEIHAVDWRAVGPRGLRQTDRLPGTPAAPLHRPLGAQQDARDPRRRERRRVARREHAELAAPPRSCTATSGSATRSSPSERPRRTSRPCSTGRWRRSATRWPTSATCA